MRISKACAGLWLASSLGLMTPCHADPLDGPDLTLLGAYSVLHVADWAQTRRIAHAPPEAFYEKNLILGPRPSPARVNRYFGATLLGQWAITAVMPPEYRKPWLSLWIGLEAHTVRKNYQIGLSARF